MQENLLSDTPKFDPFIGLDILLKGIYQTGVSSEEVQNKEVRADRVKHLENQYVVVMSFQRMSP